MATAVGSIRDLSTFRALRRPVGRSAPGLVRAAYAPCSVAPEGLDLKVAYAIGRRCGTAVQRNRLRRRCRAAVRELAPELAPGCYLLQASPSATSLPYARLRSELRSAMVAATRSRGPGGVPR